MMNVYKNIFCSFYEFFSNEVKTEKENFSSSFAYSSLVTLCTLEYLAIFAIVLFLGEKVYLPFAEIKFHLAFIILIINYFILMRNQHYILVVKEYFRKNSFDSKRATKLVATCTAVPFLMLAIAIIKEVLSWP